MKSTTKNSVDKPKVSLKTKKLKIYGILCIKTKSLVKVELNEDDIWFEFDTNMYSDNEYKVVILQISI